MIDFSPARLLVVGDVMLDRYWFGDVSRISPEAPVPVVKVGRTEERLGGAANVARNAAVLGARVSLVGVVGDDEPGGRIDAMAREIGIDSALVRDPQAPTTIKLRVIGRQQQLLRIDFEDRPSEAALVGRQQAVDARLAHTDVLILSDYGKGSLDRIEALIAQARALGCAIVVDPKGDDYTRYRGATVLTPNRSELRQVVGAWQDEADLTRRAQALRESLALEHLLLTRSEEGMTLFSAGGTRHVAAQAREVYDVSGAGDTVVAVLSAMMALDRPLDESIELANRAGGIVVGKLGTAAVSAEELFAPTGAP